MIFLISTILINLGAKADVADRWAKRLTIILPVLALLVCGWTIYHFADKWATSKFYKEREANTALAEKATAEALKYQIEAAKHAENEVKFAAENEILKATAEKQAALLDKSASDQVKRDAEQIEQNAQKLQAKLNSINSTEDDQQVFELCKEAEKSHISFSFCK